MPKSAVIRVLARSFVTGELDPEQMTARATRALGHEWPWLRALAQRYAGIIAGKTSPRHRDVVQFILQDPGFQRVWSKHSREFTVEQWLAGPQRMNPVPAARSWNIPVIESPGALADWLWLDHGELAWFADLKGLGYKKRDPQLRHYHYRVLAKPSGAVRLIEAPKRRLKKLQREILTGILENIPPHPAAHGFLRGRSIKTFAAPHVDRRVVLRMDVRDFFASFAGARIQAFFRTVGYPEAVADLLGGICTNATPRDVWVEAGLARTSLRVQEAHDLYSRPHLPQGAPTSPALANYCAYRLDCRLAGLAKSAGAEYTRYADDLAFSGDESFERCVERFSIYVAAILLEEGFQVQHRKTRVMRRGVRQYLAGVVTNSHPNVIRSDFDRLKAILTNCIRRGPESQNRDAHPFFRLHLEGRVSFVEMINPERGKRLRVLFEQIQWP